MFHQLLTPVGGSLLCSFLVAASPIFVVLFFLGALRRPAWQACLAGLLVGFIVAIGPWHFPYKLAVNAFGSGAAFALWPVMWIVFNALLLYNISVRSGRFEAFKNWIIKSLPGDRRIILVVVGFSFSALLEGIAGFGTPVAIASALLIMVGFPALDAVVFTLIFNTTPVGYAALGTPVTVLSAVTHLPPHLLAAMVGRQLPILSLLLPFYVIAVYGGIRSIRAVWPALLIAGGSFALTQFLCSNFLDYALTDVLSSLSSIIFTLILMKCWSPAHDSRFQIADWHVRRESALGTTVWKAWSPWIIVSVTVTVWTMMNVSKLGEHQIRWPGLHNAISITLYKDLPYAAIWDVMPLGTGTAILFAAIITCFVTRMPIIGILHCILETWKQIRLAVVSVVLIVGLAYLMNYSGLTYTIGLGAASAGRLFVLLSPFLGWIAVLLSGSDTSGNALFGNLQVVAANQLKLSPILMAATNSSGGVMGKMVSPQNLTTGTSVNQLKGQEGMVFARTFLHSILLTALMGIIVAIQQYLIPWIIPH